MNTEQLSTGLALLLIVILAILASSKVAVQGKFSRGFIQNTQDSVLFNAILFFLIAVLFLLIFPISTPTAPLIGFALLGGALTVSFQTCYAVALGIGPVSLTVLILNFGTLISATFSTVAFHENIYLTQGFGIILLIVSFLLSTKPDASGHKVNAKWLVTAIVTSLSNALATCIAKWVSKTVTLENGSNTYLTVMYFVASLFAFLYYGLRRLTGKKEKSTFRFSWKIPGYALAVAGILCVYQWLYLYSMARISGSLQFPTQAGTQSVIMALIGVFLFRDKLSRRQIAGVVCGIACIVMMNLKVGPFLSL